MRREEVSPDAPPSNVRGWSTSATTTAPIPTRPCTTIRAALELEERLDMFAHRAGLIREDAFDDAWERFLEDAQRYL